MGSELIKVRHVRWEIDLPARTTAEAAVRALKIMRDPDNIGLSFEMHDKNGNKIVVDLEEYAVCDNCGELIKLGEQTFRFAEIKDFFQRVEPGGMVPSCDCPKCGYLAYPATKMLHKVKP